MRHFLLTAAFAAAAISALGCTPPPASQTPPSSNKLSAPKASALPAEVTPTSVGAAALPDIPITATAFQEADGPKPDLVIGNTAFEAIAATENIVYTFDGSAVLTLDRSPRITVVDPTTGATLRSLVGSTPGKGSAWDAEVEQISPFHNGFLAISRNGQHALWRYGSSGLTNAVSTPLDIDTGERGDLIMHAVSAAGDQLWTGVRSGEVRVWDAKTKTSVTAMDSKTPRSEVPAVLKYFPNGKEVVGYGWGDGLTVYNATTGQVVVRSEDVSGKLGVFHQLTVTGSGFFASTIKNADKPTCTLRLLKLDQKGHLLASVTLRPGRINTHQLLSDGSGVVIAQGSRVLVLNADDGKERLVVQPFIGSDSDVRQLVISPDGRRALATSTLGVNTVDLTTGALHHPPVLNPLLSVQSVAFGPDNQLAYSDGRKLVVTSLSKKSTLFEWGIDGGKKIAFSADGKSLLGLGQTLFRADLTTGKILWEVSGKPSYTFTNTFVATPDLAKVVHGGDDRTLHVLDGKTGHTQRDLETPCNGIYHLVLKGNSVGCRSDKEFFLHDLTSGARVGTLPIRNIQVEALNQTLGVGYELNQDKSALVFEVATGKKKADLPMGQVFALDPNGGWVAVYNFLTGQITLRDLTTGKDQTLTRPGSMVRALASSPSGDQLAVARTGFIEVWNVQRVLRGAP